MNADKLYELLDQLGVEYEVVEIFDGLRVVNFIVEE